MNVQALESDLSDLVAKHASWLAGRTFQSVALMTVARGHFEASDLTTLTDSDAFAKSLRAEQSPHRASLSVASFGLDQLTA
jgi:hypothetical protein